MCIYLACVAFYCSVSTAHNFFYGKYINLLTEITFLSNCWSLNSHGYNNVHNQPICDLLVPSTSGSTCKPLDSEKSLSEIL